MLVKKDRLPSERFRDSVYRVPIEHTGKKIERHTGAEPASRSNSRKGANEVHAFHVEQSVEIIVFRYKNLVAIRILQVRWPMATFLRVVSVQGIYKQNNSSSIVRYVAWPTIGQRGNIGNLFKLWRHFYTRRVLSPMMRETSLREAWENSKA